MALELSLVINNNDNTPKTGVKFYSVDENNLEPVDGKISVVNSGTVDVAANGQVNIPMAGKGVILGQQIYSAFSTFDGTNFDSCLNAAGWSAVSDDGVAPPSVYKLIAIGDSFTDRGSSGTTTGDRPADKYVGINHSGYWVTGAYVHAQSDYIFRADMGKSSEGTSGLLSRIPSVLEKDADLCAIMIGANDVGANDITATKANYDSIISELRNNDRYKVLIVPCVHRYDTANNTQANAFIDELNAHCATIAATNDGVEIVPVPTELNNRMAVSGDVSDDDLHLNSVGGMLYGESIGVALDQFYPSTIEKFNIAPAFVGTGGALASGATGVVPDGYKGSIANNSTEFGFTGPVDRGDGKVWWKIRTNGGAVSGSNNISRLDLDSVACVDGKYVAEALIEPINGGENINQIIVRADSNSATYNYCELITTGGGERAFENGVGYRMRSPSAYCDGGTATLRIETNQVMGTDVELYITDVKLYKVEDIV